MNDKVLNPERSSLSLERLCRNAGIRKIVILNGVKNLIISTESIIEILPCLPAGRGYRLRMTSRRSL